MIQISFLSLLLWLRLKIIINQRLINKLERLLTKKIYENLSRSTVIIDKRNLVISLNNFFFFFLNILS